MNDAKLEVMEMLLLLDVFRATVMITVMRVAVCVIKRVESASVSITLKEKIAKHVRMDFTAILVMVVAVTHSVNREEFSK